MRLFSVLLITIVSFSAVADSRVSSDVPGLVPQEPSEEMKQWAVCAEPVRIAMDQALEQAKTQSFAHMEVTELQGAAYLQSVIPDNNAYFVSARIDLEAKNSKDEPVTEARLVDFRAESQEGVCTVRRD